MARITNDNEFRNAIGKLEYGRQRKLAGLFVNNVIALSDDERIVRVARVAVDEAASADEVAAALKTAKAATFDSHTRCGSEGDWKAQAGYFVARAAVAAVTPEGQCRSGGPAWQAAMSCRMAKTSELIDAEESTTSQENEQQYRILSEFLNS